MNTKLIILSILIFTGIFSILNIPNVQKIYRMTFVTPQLQSQKSPVVRIRLVDRGHVYENSFIAGSLVAPDGRSAFFLFVPDDVNFRTATLTVKDTHAPLLEAEHSTARSENDKYTVYILRESNHAEMIALIQSEKLHIVQPPRP